MLRIPPAFIVILSGVVAALHIGKIPPAIPVLREALGMSLIEAGFLLSLVQLAGMTSAVLIGVAADGIGLRRSILLGQALLALASLGGLATQLPATLLALRAIEGFGFLLVVLPAPSLIRQLVPFALLTRMLGLWSTYMGTGVSLALLVAPNLMPLIGWKGWWTVLGSLSALILMAVAYRVPGDRQRTAAPQAVTRSAPAGHANHHWRQRLWLTLTHAGPWRVAIAFSMYSSQWLAVIGFLPSIYAQAGWQGPLVGVLTAIACFSNVSGNVAAGRLLHRGVPPRHLLYVGFIAMGIATLLAFGEFTAQLPALRYLAVIMFSSFGGLIPSTLFSLAVHVAPSEQTVSTTVGWMQQCSSTGQFFGPPLVAWIAAQAGGWHWTWALTGVASLAGLWIARHLHLSPPKAAPQATPEKSPGLVRG